MKVVDYARTIGGKIYKVIGDDDGNYIKVENEYKETYKINISYITKLSPNILELLEPQDLLYVDIDNGFEGGIVVPRIPETLDELNNYIKKIKSGKLILKGVVTHEQLMEIMFEVN